MTDEISQLKEFNEGVTSLWADLEKDKTLGKAIMSWLDSRSSKKEIPFDENLAKAMDAWASGQKIDWSAVAKGVSTAKSAPASVPSSTTPTPSGDASWKRSLEREMSSRDIL
jgi:hypothetical protein